MSASTVTGGDPSQLRGRPPSISPSSPGTIPSNLPTSNPLLGGTTFYSTSTKAQYTIPPLNKEIEAYHNYDHTASPWEYTHQFSSIPLHEVERLDVNEQSQVRRSITQAVAWWRSGVTRTPRIYPNASEWQKIPEELRDALAHALTFDQVQGLETSSMEVRFFVNYRKHEYFLKLINEHCLQHRYTPTATSPRLQMPSHFHTHGIRGSNAVNLANLYRAEAEAELLFYVLLNIGDNRTNASLLLDPNLLYRIRRKLWKVMTM